MNKGLEALEEMTYCDNIWEREDLAKVIEKELKDYQEIKEIAKHFNWDVFTSEIFGVETDKKYRDLFNSAIVDIQKDYRKARALEIIKEKDVDIALLKLSENVERYNTQIKLTHLTIPYFELTQEEYDLLKEVLDYGK